jgi:plastocyanin
MLFSRRVLFMKQRIALVVAAAVVGVGLFATVAAARSHDSSATANKITVVMTDFHFKITKPKVLKHGVKYTVTEINKGTAVHNFDIQTVKAGKIIPKGKSQTFTITFKKAGKFQYICDVPRHAELGMAGQLTVK